MLGRGIEEEVGAGLAVRRTVGELVVSGEELVETQQRHDRVVVLLGRREVVNIDAEVPEHFPKLTLRRSDGGSR